MPIPATFSSTTGSARGKFLAISMSALIWTLAGCAPEAPEPTAAPEAPSNPEATPEPVEAPPAPQAAVGGPLNVDEVGRAARGFDVVAYHQDGQAVAGDATFSHRWSDVEWLFSSAENRDAFAQDPERFAPANGGYCTFGVVLKRKLDVDPEVFLLEQEKLFLFLNAEVKEKFMGDKDGNLALVTSQWPEIAAKSPEELAGEGG